MRFFKLFVLSLFFIQTTFASDILDTIVTREFGSCQSNNLHFSAMKFYKIPLGEKYQGYDLYLRVILFFNQDQTLSLRLTTQALIGCQTTSSNEEVCSFSQTGDVWLKDRYEINQDILVKGLGVIKWNNPKDTNRGFSMTFSSDFPYEKLRHLTFIGGMITVNFDQNGRNTINICKE